LHLMGHAKPQISDHAMVLDTLALARKLHPGQRNSLDALCKRYEVDASRRDVHGALIDAELLAKVYLAMTGGQTALLLEEERGDLASVVAESSSQVRGDGIRLVVINASDAETAAHEQFLQRMRAEGQCVWPESD